MNRIILYIFSLCFSVELYSAEENVHLVTDRSVYLSNETILYNCVLTSDMQQQGVKWSNTIYIQLVDRNGNKISSNILETTGAQSEGRLNIPQDTPSGYYLLHAETKWMRNYPVKENNCAVIKVLNPKLKTHYKKNANDIHLRQSNSEFNQITILLSQKNIKNRTRVEASILVDKMPNKDQKSQFTISVVPKFVNSTQPDVKFISQQPESHFFIPESQGLLLSGKIINPKKIAPSIHLSFFNQELGCYTAYADSNNSFRIHIPYYFGSSEAFIYCSDSSAQLAITSQFRSLMPDLPKQLQLTQQEVLHLNTLAFHATINSQYNSPLSSHKNQLKKQFYGEPTESIVFDDYIALPSIQEYITELLLHVTIKAEKGEKHIEFINNPYTNRIFPPLLLLDMLKTNNTGNFLSLDPKDIERIDAVAHDFKVGDQTYSGILSVFTKKHDFAGFKIPEGGHFSKIESYTPNTPFYNITEKEIQNERTPILRSCIYWKPNIQLSESGQFSFYTGDSKGEFEITVTGISENGDVYKGCKIFTVE